MAPTFSGPNAWGFPNILMLEEERRAGFGPFGVVSTTKTGVPCPSHRVLEVCKNLMGCRPLGTMRAALRSCMPGTMSNVVVDVRAELAKSRPSELPSPAALL
eukprot:GHVS01103678.1.p3 GENE.GHVS01103678.1~~GHVS01103678.1.p3  ORF type:complete len:102 (+),score=5.52 GHVS01103678.1:1018-1323(+)